MTKLLPKIISVKLLLSNGIFAEEKNYKIENKQDCYDTVEIGNYVLVPSPFEKNIISVGRILSIDMQEKEITLSDHLENIICHVDIDEFKLVEGLSET